MIVWLKSPVATAVVTRAMSRTWSVRLLAIRFTLSVSSRQIPCAPRTSACPPSLPSTPTARAMRVTSSAKKPSCSTIVLIVFLRSSSSPRTSTCTFLLRSPAAIAVATRAMSRT